MATYAYPATSLFLPSSFDFGIRSNVMVSTSKLSGSIQTVETPGSRWLASLSYDIQNANDRAEVEAFWAKVRGQAHRVSLWHQRRPTPRGTITGTPTLTSAISQGATTCAFSNAGTGTTLLPGDLFSFGSSGQLVMCTNSSTLTSSGGSMSSVEFSPPARSTVTSATPIVLTRPTATFMVTGTEVRVPYSGYVGSGFSVDLMEVF